MINIHSLWESTSLCIHQCAQMLTLAQVNDPSITVQTKPLDWVDIVTLLLFTGLALFAVCKSSWRR